MPIQIVPPDPSEHRLFLTSGLGLKEAQDRYYERRRALVEKVGHPILITAVPQDPNRNIPWSHIDAPIYQDPLFTFLTGILQPGLVLLIHPSNPMGCLFLPPYRAKKTFWEGFHFGVGDPSAEQRVQSITGISDLSALSTMLETVLSTLKTHEGQKLGLFWEQSAKTSRIYPDYHQDFRKRLRRSLIQAGLSPQSIVNISETVWPFRLTLDKLDQAHLLDANISCHEAFSEILRNRPWSNEGKLAGTLIGHLRSRSHQGLSFPPIVASGAQATTLHYTANDQPIHPESLVLLDFGLRRHAMHADISRTIPAKGRFNPMQRILYESVLETQYFVEQNVKPGVTLRHLNAIAWPKMFDLLAKNFTNKGGKMHLPYQKIPHNIGHLLGYQVHDGDAFRDYRESPLQAGWVITNEPGLYGHFSWTFQGISYEETLGIRIEDNLLITASGSKNLTSCPKQVEDLEY